MSREPSLFRKKPVVVEAMQYPGLRELPDAQDVLAWLDSHGVQYRHDGGLIIPTLEGDHRADPGDWIVRGVAGEFYPVKPAIFDATYEPVVAGPLGVPEFRERVLTESFLDAADEADAAQAEIRRLREQVALAAADTTAPDLRQTVEFVRSTLDRFEEVNAAREHPSQMATDLIASVRLQLEAVPGQSTRLVWPDGKVVPRTGDLALVLVDVTLEGDGQLAAGQNVLVEHVLERVPEVVGVKWRDADGTHAMALDVAKLEVVA